MVLPYLTKEIMSTQESKILIVLLVLSFLFLASNMVINNIMLDVICGILFSYTIAMYVALAQGVFNDKVLLFKMFILLFVIYSIIYLFLFSLFKKYSEQTIVISKKEYEGNIAKVTLSIPKGGVGEVLMVVANHKVAIPAKIYAEESFEGDMIEAGTEVLIINSPEDAKPVVEVQVYNSFLKNKN